MKATKKCILCGANIDSYSSFTRYKIKVEAETKLPLISKVESFCARNVVEGSLCEPCAYRPASIAVALQVVGQPYPKWWQVFLRILSI